MTLMVKLNLRFCASARAVLLAVVFLTATAVPPAVGAPQFSSLQRPLSANDLPASLLNVCDAKAAGMGYYAGPIADAMLVLIELGVLSFDDFRGVSIGFCGLRAAGGPVGTTSCAEDIILLDSNYAGTGQELALAATLAHEMKHVRQHRQKRAARGIQYCDSTRYRLDAPTLEAEADAFGDATARLALLGRSLEIHNGCAGPVHVHLETEKPIARAPADIGFHEIAAGKTIVWPGRTASSAALFHAWSKEVSPSIDGARNGQRVIIDGAPYFMSRARLSVQAPTRGPFRLTIDCDETLQR